MKQIEKKMGRVRLVLIAAAAIGCASATLSGTLAVLAVQDPTMESLVA